MCWKALSFRTLPFIKSRCRCAQEAPQGQVEHQVFCSSYAPTILPQGVRLLVAAGGFYSRHLGSLPLHTITEVKMPTPLSSPRISSPRYFPSQVALFLCSERLREWPNLYVKCSFTPSDRRSKSVCISS